MRQIFGGETRRSSPSVTFTKRRCIADGSRKETAAERVIRNKADAELFERRNRVALVIASPKGIFALHSGNRVNRVSATNRLRPGFAQSEVAHLSLLYELGHCANGLFDRYFRINAVQIVEVNVIGLQSPQRILTSPENIFRLSFDFTASRPWLPAQITKLGREHYRVAFAFERCSENLFVVAVVVIRGIDEIDADLDRPV